MKYLKSLQLILCIIFMSTTLNVFAYTPIITNLKITTVNQHPHITFFVNHPFRYHIFTLKKPNRLVIDFKDTKTFKTFNSKNNFIQHIRSAKHGQDGWRIVFDLKQTAIPHDFVLKPHKGKEPYRLIIDLISQNTSPTLKTTTKPLKPIKFKNTPLRDAVVVIDPGHGGKDPGAIGHMGTKEKNIVLAIGEDLYHLLKKQYGIDPRLTRHGDYFVPLRERLKLARNGVADLFIAIHADAYRYRSARGTSVFALSEHGASTEAARWLAQKENYSELMGGIDLSDKSYMLRSVLIDLSQTATIRDSLRLGSFEISTLKHVARLHHGSVEQAPFVVLKSPDIPSILVETGFLSNRYEEKKLRTSIYQHQIAHALMQGIVEYLHRYPPKGTYLAAKK